MSAEERPGPDGRLDVSVEQRTREPAQQGPSVSVVEAARLLGQSPDAVVSALQRHALRGWCDEHGEWHVAVGALSSLLDGRDMMGILRDQLDRLQNEVRQARDAAELVRRQADDRQAALADLRVALARAEERIRVCRSGGNRRRRDRPGRGGGQRSGDRGTPGHHRMASVAMVGAVGSQAKAVSIIPLTSIGRDSM